MHVPVERSRRVGGRLIHRFQLLRGPGDSDDARDWVVVDFDASTITLATPDFEWTRTVPAASVAAGEYVPLEADGTPIWGY